MEGRLVVEGMPISEVVDTIRHYYQGMIIVRDRTLAERTVTGTYDLRDPVAALAAVVAPYGGIVTRITPFILLVSHD